MPDRDKLIEELELHTIGRSRRSGDKYVVTLELRFVNSILDMLKSQPQIVRCKECRFYFGKGFCNRSGINLEVNDDWFCADGEHKEGR